MPSFTIHLAVGKKYLENHKDEDYDQFYKGVIAPDLKEKPASHFGPASSQPGLERFKQEVGLNSSYDRGYYLHLLTDKLFYQQFLKKGQISKEIYHDYDILNRGIIKCYQLELPEEIKGYISFFEGDTKVIDAKSIYCFIEAVATFDLEAEILGGELEEKMKGDCCSQVGIFGTENAV